MDIMRQTVQAMNQGCPHALALGIETLSIGPEGSVLRAAFKPELIGDPDTGVIAGGVVTTLLDHACGQAVHSALRQFTSIATLDLPIDYMRPAQAGKDIFARAHCYKATRSVAFVRAVAYDDDPDDPVAAAQAAFMLDSSTGRGFGANLKPTGKAGQASGKTRP